MNKYKMKFEKHINEYICDGFLSDAIKYAMLGDANRIRPQVLMAWCEACGGNIDDAIPLAMAVECGHTMSLIHDDLPCMDDAVTRRGKQCLHLATSEATAVLSGDMLLSAAFFIIANCNLSDKQRLVAIKILSKTACLMADGQYAELCGASESWQTIYYDKTAALLEAACMLGVVAANGSPEQMLEAQRYGKGLGMAYQIVDDIKDNDGIAANTALEDLRCMIQEFHNDCDVGYETESRAFLTTLAKKVLG